MYLILLQKIDIFPLTSVKRGSPPPSFDSFEEHPFATLEKKSTPSGAYRITFPTWKLIVPKWVVLNQNEAKFSPVVQDRIAISIMQMHPGQGWGPAKYQTMVPTSLALVRTGKIEEAARQLATTSPIQWTSLPAGKESRGYTVKKMLDDYEKYIQEL